MTRVALTSSEASEADRLAGAGGRGRGEGRWSVVLLPLAVMLVLSAASVGIWRLRILDVAEDQRGRVVWRTLAPGLMTSGVMAWLVGLAMRRRWRVAEEARRQLAGLHAMTETAGVIAGMREAAGGRAALDRVASAARGLLGVRMAAIVVADEGSGLIEVVARDGFVEKENRLSYAPHETPTVCRCMASREVIEVRDVAEAPGVNRAGLEAWGIRSALFAPLVVQGKAIGCLILADRAPRRFGESEKHLARAMGSQVAVILANQRLIREKDEALAMQRRLAEQREAMYQISREIYESERLEDSLQRLADAAPAVMGVDLCGVNLRVGKGEQLGDEMDIVAMTGNYANCRGERWSAAGLRPGEALRTREMRVVEDAQNDPAVHPVYKHRLRLGSVVYVPLYVPLPGGQTQMLGLMTLIRHSPGAFSAEQLELAAAVGARAASAIRTARLHEQAVQSAKTHETLLRELHHRVKNNLASIVTLLSMNRPEMSAEAREWLDRATQRIATMARTHELFVGGRERVRVDELVNRLLPALSLVKPPGVEVRTDVSGVGLMLDTEQAVSLAIVLNELCWNALEHGTGGTGVLEIRGREEEGGRLILEIEDQGRDGAADGGGFAFSDAERGTGLRLVDGLVSRELKGRFELRSAPRGGTVARLEVRLGGE